MIVEKSTKPNETIYMCDKCKKILKANERVGFYKTNENAILKYFDLCKRCSKSLEIGVFRKRQLKKSSVQK